MEKGRSGQSSAAGRSKMRSASFWVKRPCVIGAAHMATPEGTWN